MIEPTWSEVEETPGEHAANSKIELWHLGLAAPDQTLEEFMGWSPEEFDMWARTGKVPNVE